MEWWDNLILANGKYEDEAEIREEAITSLIEHPIQVNVHKDPFFLYFY